MRRAPETVAILIFFSLAEDAFSVRMKKRVRNMGRRARAAIPKLDYRSVSTQWPPRPDSIGLHSTDAFFFFRFPPIFPRDERDPCAQHHRRHRSTVAFVLPSVSFFLRAFFKDALARPARCGAGKSCHGPRSAIPAGRTGSRVLCTNTYVCRCVRMATRTSDRRRTVNTQH